MVGEGRKKKREGILGSWMNKHVLRKEAAEKWETGDRKRTGNPNYTHFG
jgi:hypothetical protein